MALPYSYKTGTASVTANSKTVTGTDTKWLAAGLQAGDVFAVQGLSVSIASVETSTSLTLDFAWPGSTATETSYEARYTPDATRVMAYARQAIDTMSEFDANLYGSLNVYASTAAGIAAVADGSQFSVVSGNDWIRYRRSGSGAVELARMPTSAALINLAASVPGLQTQINSEVAARQASVQAVTAALTVTDGELSVVQAEIAAPLLTVAKDAVNWTWWDAAGNALGGWDGSGLRVVLADWTAANLAPRILAVKGVDAQIETGQTPEGYVLERDAAGNVLRVLRADGQDMMMSVAFWERGAEILGGGSNRLSTTAVQIISEACQSLGVGGGWTAEVVREDIIAKANPAAALMLTGMVNVDAQPIYTDGPRSKAYDHTVPAAAFGPALPPVGQVTAPYPLAATVNLYRADLGLPQVPVVTTAHGIPGVAIEDMDPDPATGAGPTLIWDNMSWWYDEVKRLLGTSGLGGTVPYHDWIHGTSAKQDAAGVYLAALWRYQRDFRSMLAAKGLSGGATFVMSQPGGDANTIAANGEDWNCCDEILQFCEAGGGILATPEYAYQIADNNVHPDASWTIQMQEVKARAIAETEAGRGWMIRRPKATRTGTVIVLDFDSLRPDEHLTLHDPARYGGQGIDAFAGFEAVGTTIAAMEITGRQVRLTCAGVPTGVRYAYQQQDCTGFAGNLWTGHRGLLRTSDTWSSKLLADVVLYRWIPSFRITL